MGLVEIRWHGRGGQGVVTSAEMLVSAAIYEGKYAIAIPFFGAERRGAPVVAYNRISDTPIRIRCPILNPDYVVLLDERLGRMIDVVRGLKSDGVLVVNSKSVPEWVDRKDIRIATVDATSISMSLGLELAGIVIVNMPMLGALIKVSNIVSLNSLTKAIKAKWKGERMKQNLEAVTRAYNETVIW
ncbi:MAG: hypothetical protein B6U94_08015 [Thermofilum sp. ex4484_79]|nr:MAG: hypothetical protein B6U94_08015 [Thermofilum sp. ex4484_79]